MVGSLNFVTGSALPVVQTRQTTTVVHEIKNMRCTAVVALHTYHVTGGQVCIVDADGNGKYRSVVWSKR